MACPATRVLLLLLAWPALQVLAGKEIKPTLATGATPSSTEVPLVLVAVSQSSSTSVSRGPTPAPAVQVVLPGSTPAAVVTPSTPELSSRHEELDLEEANNTREALSSQGSEHNSVVFVADGAGYVPVTQLRSRVPANFGRLQLQPQQEVSTVALSEDASEWSQNWDRGYNHYRHNYSRVQHIEAECQDDFMKIRVGFNGSFSGVLYSSGYSYDPECVYVNGTGRDYYEFYIQMNRCGTLGKNTANELSRKQPSKNFMWNTVTVQYNPMIEEEWDEHFKVTCEYGYDFWKTVTFPFLDVEVATGNPLVFTLSPPECYMEVRHGYGITGNRVSGPVRVGDPLTLLIYMRSKYDGFDIVVNDCYAHNGANKRIQLIDQYGCPVDEKLISRFRGSWSETGIYETQVFAYMKTFRFTGSPALYVECDVRMCHGKCSNQPCHWRNAKSVRRRSVANDLLLSTLAPQTVALSENISLFQSLRVLQEGEHSDEDDSTLRAHRLGNGGGGADSICVKSGAFTALFGLGCVLTAGLGLAVTLLCFRVRALGKGAPLELTDTEARTNRELLAASSTSSLHTVDFLTHKGRIH